MKKVLLSVGIFHDIEKVRDSIFSQRITDGYIDVLYQGSRVFDGDNWGVNNSYQVERAFNLALVNGYDYVMIVADDIELPERAVQSLVDSGKHFVSGIHRLDKRNAGDYHIMARIVDPDGEQDADDRYITLDDIKSLPPVFITTQADFSCFLCTDKVFQDVNISWTSEREIIDGLNAAGIHQYVNTDVRCVHHHAGDIVLTI